MRLNVVNMCDYCNKEIPTCNSEIIFASEIRVNAWELEQKQNDVVVGCSQYVPKEAKMLTELNGINTDTPEGKLAIAVLARITGKYDTYMTPNEVMIVAQEDWNVVNGKGEA